MKYETVTIPPLLGENFPKIFLLTKNKTKSDNNKIKNLTIKLKGERKINMCAPGETHSNRHRALHVLPLGRSQPMN